MKGVKVFREIWKFFKTSEGIQVSRKWRLVDNTFTWTYVAFLTLFHLRCRPLSKWQHTLGTRLVLQANPDDVVIYVSIFLCLRNIKLFLLALFFLLVKWTFLWRAIFRWCISICEIIFQYVKYEKHKQQISEAATQSCS